MTPSIAAPMASISAAGRVASPTTSWCLTPIGTCCLSRTRRAGGAMGVPGIYTDADPKVSSDLRNLCAVYRGPGKVAVEFLRDPIRAQARSRGPTDLDNFLLKAAISRFAGANDT